MTQHPSRKKFRMFGFRGSETRAARVIGRIFALCRAGYELRGVGACRVFAESLRRAVGRFWRKTQSGRAPTARSLKLTNQDRRARFPVLKRSSDRRLIMCNSGAEITGVEGRAFLGGVVPKCHVDLVCECAPKRHTGCDSLPSKRLR